MSSPVPNFCWPWTNFSRSNDHILSKCCGRGISRSAWPIVSKLKMSTSTNVARNKTNFGWPCSNSSRSNFTRYVLRVFIFNRFKYIRVFILIVSKTYKPRAIAGWINLHFFSQIFTMANSHVFPRSKVLLTLIEFLKVK
jgi:hypothetical protein